MEKFENRAGKSILEPMVFAIQKNKEYLSTIDGQIGDGDHGVNMNKGFTLFQDRCLKEEKEFIQGLWELADILFNEIGGSMGIIYGAVFSGMAEAGKEFEHIGLSEFFLMIKGGYEELGDFIEAKPGDKTIVDTLQPAIEALEKAKETEVDFSAALKTMKKAAKEGMESTKNMRAKYGRSSRLGDRSIGKLDAGAVSCYFIVQAMADAIEKLIREEED